MDLYNKYFHGIVLRDKMLDSELDDIYVLESILKSGFIYNRYNIDKNMRKLLDDICFQGKFRVSVACHEEKNKEYLHSLNMVEKKFLVLEDYEDAYNSFINNYISIIFNDELLEKYKYIKKGLIGEYQIVGNVSLDDMIGIGLPYGDVDFKLYERIDKLLKKYNYNIPIVTNDGSLCNKHRKIKR